MQAIILAGGFGTRLAPLVGGVPKPMAPVAGKPFLSWLLDYMGGQGVSETVLCLHHMAGQVKDHFGARYGAMKLHYTIEETPLGTGGAIRAGLQALGSREPVFALNGDSLVRVNYARMMAHHWQQGRPMTMATYHAADRSRYGALTLSNGRVTEFGASGQSGEGPINTGFYVLSPEIFSHYGLPASFSLEEDFLAPNAAALQPAAYDGTGFFLDIGVPTDYRAAQASIPELFMKKAA